MSERERCPRWKCRHTQWEAIDEIQKGDVILWNRKHRKVRDVIRCQKGLLHFIVFAIMRQSWTGRPYTTYYRPEVSNSFGGIVREGVLLCSSPLECEVQRAVEEDLLPGEYIKAQHTVGRVY
jgi:hypothetical protein